MSNSKNFVGTTNNPEITLEEMLDVLKRLPHISAARVQLEKGAEGTPHFQWVTCHTKYVHWNTMKKKFPTSHVEKAKNAMASWNYCGKEDTRIEGPQ